MSCGYHHLPEFTQSIQATGILHHVNEGRAYKAKTDSLSGMYRKPHDAPDIPSSVWAMNVSVFQVALALLLILTGLWRGWVNWHGATRRPAWRSTRWCRTGWTKPCSGSSWPRSGTGCLGSSYGSEPHHTLCGATGGLTWDDSEKEKESYMRGCLEEQKKTFAVNMTLFIKCLTERERGCNNRKERKTDGKIYEKYNSRWVE